MKIIMNGPEPKLETHGQGPIVRGVARDMDKAYAYGLIVSGRVQPVDEASRKEYADMRQSEIEAAVKAGKSIYCDSCQHEIDATEFQDNGCPRCPVDNYSVKAEA